MKKGYLWFLIMGCALLLFAPPGANAAFVTFNIIGDGDGSPQNFDPATSVAAGNTLNIGLNDFKAEGSPDPLSPAGSALDTLSFTIEAPDGYYVKRVTYYEEGKGQTTNGVAMADGSITAASIPNNLLAQLFKPNTGPGGWSIDGYVDIPGQQQLINVSLVNSLFATTFGGASDIAWIEKTAASVTAEIALVPIPSALWLLSSGLFCLLGLRRRFHNQP